MAVIELVPYDIFTSDPRRAYALQPFWSNLTSLGARSARLLVVTDHLNYESALEGFNKVSVPFEHLPRDMRWYRSYYEGYMQGTIRETQFIRAFLIVNSVVGEETLRQLVAGYGIRTKPLDGEGVPLPFTYGQQRWDKVIDDRSRHWSVLQSTIDQTGAVVPQVLHQLFRQEFPVYVGIDIWNYTRTEAAQMLKTKAAVAAVSLAKVQNRESALEANDAQQTIDAFRREIGTVGVGLHEVRLSVAVFGNSQKELSQRLEMVKGVCSIDLNRRPSKSEALAKMFSAVPPNGRHGTLSTSTHVTVLASSALSYSRPTNTEGVLIGFDGSQSPVVINLFDLDNKAYNAVVIGQTGAGKTFFVLLLMLRSLLTGVRLIIIDPKGDIDLSWIGRDDQGREMCQRVVVGTEQSSINILDPIFPEINNQIEFVMSGLAMLGIYDRHNSTQKTILDIALEEIYASFDWKAVNPDEIPTFKDLMEKVKEVGGRFENQMHMYREAQLIAFHMVPFATGSRAPLFGSRTNVDFSLKTPVTVFDVSNFPSRQTGAAMRSMLFATLFGMINQSIVTRRKAGDRAPMQFFVDEIGVLMRDAVVADYVSDKYKTARSLGVSMIVADQTLASLLGPVDEHGVHHGNEMFANAPHRFIFFQEGNEREMTQKKFPMMPAAYKDQIHQLPRGQCIAQIPQGTFRVIVTASDLEKVVLSSALHDKERAKRLIAQMRRELEEI
ncbi:MAG: ATP-binding protein [Chloroflexota bacterium]